MSSSSQSTHQATPLLLTRNRHYPIPFTCRFRKGANLIKRNQRKQRESLAQSMIISKNPTMKRLWSPIRFDALSKHSDATQKGTAHQTSLYSPTTTAPYFDDQEVQL